MLETGDERILVDCGMFQGGEEHEKKNADPFPFDVRVLSAVFVTHAHLDHVGRLPLLVKAGYEGFFYGTPPTRDLTRLILEDAYSVMEFDHRKYGRPLLYSMQDVEAVMAQFKVLKYYEEFELPPKITKGNLKKLLQKPKKKGSGIRVILKNAGHIFGSAFVEMLAEGKKIVFSGDVGNINTPILPDTDALPQNVDLLICESTYGDRYHESADEKEKLVQELFQNAMTKGGVLMIPSFALERTQELLYELNDLIERQEVLGKVPVFLDSPLAIDALKVYEQYTDYYDKEALSFFKSGDDIFNFPGLTKAYTRDESMKINNTRSPKVVIAGAGMMTGGRILHHAIRYLSDKHNTLLLIGYQSPGTLGWKILNHHDRVPVMGESVAVNCNVIMINAFSAHGDKNKLMSWIQSGGEPPKQIILNHGDQISAEALATTLKEKKIEVEVAKFNKPRKI